MNCKFCNNFIPDDAKICSICGKNVEEALVKAEPTELATEAPAAPVKEKAEKTYKKKSLVLPLVIILIAAAAFIGIYGFGGVGKLSALLEGNKAEAVLSESDQNSLVDTENENIALGESTDGTVEKNASEDNSNLWLTNIAANGAAALVGAGGIALFGKRVVGNRKAKKQGN